jgi:Ca-activated chloride channel homolog
MIRVVSGLAIAAILQVPSFHAEARLVVLYVSVRNAHGEVVTTLDPGAFKVYENGKRQPVSVFRRDDVPVSVGLLIDNSGSMRAARPQVEAAALAFAKASHPDDELFVVNFADKARLDVPFTSDRGVLERSIARVDAIGGTAMRDAVEVAETYLHDCGKQDRRALLIITDGNDNARPSTTRRKLQPSAPATPTISDLTRASRAASHAFTRRTGSRSTARGSCRFSAIGATG